MVIQSDFRLIQQDIEKISLCVKSSRYHELNNSGEGHFGAADSALDNSAPFRFGAVS